MIFKDIIGQEKTIDHLKKNLLQKKLVHAYLFEGQKGLGKRKIAFEFVKGICCKNQQEIVCDQCTSCIKLNHGNHPEVKWIYGENGIKIDQIRELQKEIQKKPYEGHYKIYIICDAHKMNIQAQNAFLKTLEEPPAYAKIILLVENARNILPTISSRCQIYRLIPVEEEKIKSFLINNKKIDKERANIIANCSNGIIGRALQLIGDEEFFKRREKIIQLVRTLFEDNIVELLEMVKIFNEEKNHIEELLDALLAFYRDLFVYQTTKATHLILNKDQLAVIELRAQEINAENIDKSINIIEETKNNIKHNVNYQLNMEVMLINLQSAFTIIN